MSGQQAAGAARQAYIGGYSQGLRNEDATPCAAAEASFRKNHGSDKNGVLEAALAYMNAAPSTLCGEAGKAYIAACTAALQGSAKTTGGSGNLNSAFETFISSASAGTDPVCTAAAGAYIDAKIAKKSDEGALGAAAKAYIAALGKNPGAGGACSKAASSFTGKANPFVPAAAPVRLSADPTAAAANFLNAVGGTDICAKASKAYLAAVTAGKSAAQATNAAKQAYISAYNAGTRNAPGTACAAAEVNFKSAAQATNAAKQAYISA